MQELMVQQVASIESQGNAQAFGDSGSLDLFDNLPGIDYRQRFILVEIVVIVIDGFTQSRQIAVQLAGDKRGHHVIHQGRHAATPGDKALTYHIDIVNIDVGYVCEQGIGRVLFAQARIFTIQPLQGAMCPHMDNGIDVNLMTQPGIGGHILMVRCQIIGVVKLLQVLTPASHWLWHQDDIAVLQSGYDKYLAIFILISHQVFCGGVSPIF